MGSWCLWIRSAIRSPAEWLGLPVCPMAPGFTAACPFPTTRPHQQQVGVRSGGRERSGIKICIGTGSSSSAGERMGFRLARQARVVLGPRRLQAWATSLNSRGGVGASAGAAGRTAHVLSRPASNGCRTARQLDRAGRSDVAWPRSAPAALRASTAADQRPRSAAAQQRSSAAAQQLGNAAARQRRAPPRRDAAAPCASCPRPSLALRAFWRRFR